VLNIFAKKSNPLRQHITQNGADCMEICDFVIQGGK
jgi:hypothetical protein